MRIHSFKYANKSIELAIGKMEFKDLTLLVGASGVGKTLILNSLLDLKSIARGRSLSGVEWSVRFSTDTMDEIYHWKGAFDNIGLQADRFVGSDEKVSEEISPGAKIKSEKLFLNDRLIVEREGNKIILEGKPTPKLSSYKSLLNLFNEEDTIAPAFESLNKIIKSDIENVRIPIAKNFDELLKKYGTLENIQKAPLPLYLKLALAYGNKLQIFNTIKNHFINVFSQVEDIKLEVSEEKGFLYFFSKTPLLKIKERSVSNWIFQDRISSGMYKTLMYISQLFLCDEGTLILIDEFENSLGINCIDSVTENLLSDDRSIQFIITSHHPYIINAIDMEDWKIVSRRGGVISSGNATDYKLGKSRHEAFKQLIQLSDYREGIKGS